jgi:hypothetical protein
MLIQHKEEYRGLEPHRLEDKVYELAFTYQKFSRSCCQSLVAAFHRMFEIDDIVVKVATSCTSGHASQCIGNCGGLTGGTLVLDYFFGRPVENLSCTRVIRNNLEMLDKAQKASYLLYQNFKNEYGSILCPHIQARLCGRPYYLWDPHESSEFQKVGGYSRISADVIGTVARWVLNILMKNSGSSFYFLTEGR